MGKMSSDLCIYNCLKTTNTRPSRPLTYLLVGEDEEDGVPEFVLVQHPVELFLGLTHSLSVVAIHHEDQPLRVLRLDMLWPES